MVTLVGEKFKQKIEKNYSISRPVFACFVFDIKSSAR
jgi:hypothetical protein